MLGLSRNVWFGIGGVMLAVVLFLGFSGDDESAEDGAKVVDGKKKKKGKKKKRRDKGSMVVDGGLGVPKMCAKLDCSDAQLRSFKDMVREHRKSTSTQRRALAAAHAKIAAELAEDTLDTAALDDAFAAASEQREAIDANARGVLESMHGKLSKPQRETLAKLVARYGPTMLLARPADGPGKSKGKRGKRGRKRKREQVSGRTRPTPAPAPETTGQDRAAPALDEGGAEAEPAEPEPAEPFE